MPIKLINQKRAERVESIRKIAFEIMDCNSARELNDISSNYIKEIEWPEVRRRFDAASRRILAKEINNNFENN